MSPIRLKLVSVLALAGAMACSSSAPTTAGQVQFSLATRGTAVPFVVDTQTAGADVLVFDSVHVVLRKIELERVNDDACNQLTGSNHDNCEELNLGPILLNLPLGPGADRQFTVAVDTGLFGEIEFEIHKPKDDGNATDRQFLIDHPTFADVSIQVKGTFNGTPFVYTTDLEAEQEMKLVPPLDVKENSNINVTLKVDIRRWFMNAAGTGLVDPAQANKGGPFESLVKDNIKASLEAFEDDNHDGDHD